MPAIVDHSGSTHVLPVACSVVPLAKSSHVHENNDVYNINKTTSGWIFKLASVNPLFTRNEWHFRFFSLGNESGHLSISKLAQGRIYKEFDLRQRDIRIHVCPASDVIHGRKNIILVQKISPQGDLEPKTVLTLSCPSISEFRKWADVLGMINLNET